MQGVIITHMSLFQCSFIPRFTVQVTTKYEDNNGSTENVSLLLRAIPDKNTFLREKGTVSGKL